MTMLKMIPQTLDSQPMIGASSEIEEIKAYLTKAASTESNVLITGETGTGKELAAELIHIKSKRHQNPFVCINCAAIPDELFESELFGYERGAFTGAHGFNQGKLKMAEGGTVFLDEIGEMSPYMQAKILRAIESKTIQRLGGKGNVSLNVRFIAATNQDLEAGVTDGKFRKDLFFRLNVVRVHLPPLRERKEDIPSLLHYYLQEWNSRTGTQVEGFSDEALESLLRYDWPGNIRELRNLLEAVFVSPPLQWISFNDFPKPFRRHLGNDQGKGEDECDRLLVALSSTNWNRSEAARKLQWSRMTLYRKMAKYHVERNAHANLLPEKLHSI
jgi:transcriptional regulator with PAS, ATPase and Fis domain